MEQIKKTKRTAIIIWAIYVLFIIIMNFIANSLNNSNPEISFSLFGGLFLSAFWITTIVYTVKLAKVLNRSPWLWGILAVIPYGIFIPILFFLKAKEKPVQEAESSNPELQSATLTMTLQELQTKVIDMALNRKGLNEISAFITGAGISGDQIKPVLQNAESEIREKLRKGGNNNIIFGLLWTFGGIIATIISISSESDVQYVFWGAILFGFIQFISGIVQSSRGNNYKIT